MKKEPVGPPSWAARRCLWLLVSALTLGSAACGDRSVEGRPDEAPPKPVVYEAIGASESAGVGADDPATQAWPVVFWKTALPEGTVFHNHGIPGATVKQALAEEVPKALANEPTLTTVWLNVNDMLDLVTVKTYEDQLTDLVRQLRRGGATKVLVANVPPLDRLPSYLACRRDRPADAPPCRVKSLGLIPPGLVDAFVGNFNAAIARVAEKEGAVLVDLYAAGLAARSEGTEASLVAADGFHPSTAGHRAAADTFSKALADSGGP